MAYIDEQVFKEVMVNLIANAIEAMDHEQHKKIYIDVKEQGGWGIIEIKDNGRGIKREDLNKIFTPFFSTKSSISNWGIGLAFCYRVITAHDGKITVDSKVGEGTVISIALPVV